MTKLVSGRLLSFLAFLPFLFLSGCGYRLGPSPLVSGYRTLSVPYVVHDPLGDLTAILIREVARTGTWRYCREGGDLLLCVTLLGIEEENVGYQYEPKNRKKRREEEAGDLNLEEGENHEERRRQKVKHTTVPNETRLVAVAVVSLIDAKSRQCLLGPVQIAGTVDFDHDYYESPDAVNVFSLGQLTDVEQAYEAALTPLYHHLARNIVEYIRYAW